MIRRLLLPLPILLVSCGLVRAPFKVAGGVVQGTANVTRAAVTAPGDALEARRRKKQAEELVEERRRGEADPVDPAGIPGTPAGYDSDPPIFDDGGPLTADDLAPPGIEAEPLPPP